MMHRTTIRVLVALAITLAAPTFVGTASAGDPKATKAGKPGKKEPNAAANPTKPAPAYVMTPAVLASLRSGDEAQVQAALDDLRMLGKSAASSGPAIGELLQKGLTLKLSESALDTLGDIEAESVGPVLAMYVIHRNVTLRRAAIKALIHTRGPGTDKALRRALSDADPMVRGVAATGLGSMKARDAVPVLFLALDHKVPEAAAAIGQLCGPQECDQLAGKLGRLPFDVVTNGLDQVLFRPPVEVSDDAKVKILGRVRELGTREASKFLKDVQTRWPATWSVRVKQTIDQAVLATAGAAQ